MSTPETAFSLHCPGKKLFCYNPSLFLLQISYKCITLIESKSRGNLGSTVLASQLGNAGGQGHRRWSKGWPSDTRQYVIQSADLN